MHPERLAPLRRLHLAAGRLPRAQQPGPRGAARPPLRLRRRLARHGHARLPAGDTRLAQPPHRLPGGAGSAGQAVRRRVPRSASLLLPSPPARRRRQEALQPLRPRGRLQPAEAHGASLPAPCEPPRPLPRLLALRLLLRQPPLYCHCPTAIAFSSPHPQQRVPGAPGALHASPTLRRTLTPRQR